MTDSSADRSHAPRAVRGAFSTEQRNGPPAAGRSAEPSRSVHEGGHSCQLRHAHTLAQARTYVAALADEARDPLATSRERRHRHPRRVELVQRLLDEV